MIVNYGGYDSLGIAYNTLADTYFLVIHGRAPATFPQEDVGAEISSAGVAGVEFDVTATGNKLGNFNPRIAASSTRNEWMMVTSSGFAVASAQRIKTLAAGGGPPPPPPPPPPPIDLSAAGAPNGSWFLAEGAESGTATGFHTFYLVANEHDDPVDARVWFAGDDGTLKYRTFTVAARSRNTISLASVANGAFGAIFQSTTPGRDIFVARSIYWGPNFEGSTGVSAVKGLSNSWYFAEGSRGGELFDNFFLVFNPLPTPTTVNVTFLTASGQVITRQYPVAAQKRLTLYANDIPELAGKDFSTTITAATGVVAERAMYWRLIGSPDPSWVGGAASVGAIAPQTTWVFAEGAAAPNFESFYLLLNPNSTALTVRARFLPETGMPTVRNITIAPRSRATVYLNGVLGNIGGVASTFTSDTLAIPGRALNLLGRRARRGHQRHRRLVGGECVALPGGRLRRPVRHLPAARQPRHRRLDGPPDAVHRRGRPLHRVAGRTVEDGPRRLTPDHLYERVPLRARNGRRPSGRQPARQVVQHQD